MTFDFDSEPPELPCKEKLAFDTKQQADGAALTVKYQHGTTVHSYLCRHCKLWHLASGSAD
jgi:hypothetical protein